MMPAMSRPSASTVERWHAALRLFRFSYAIGGHANDGDTFTGNLPFAGEAGLVALCEGLGIGVRKVADSGFMTLFGCRVFVAIQKEQVQLMLSGADGDPYECTEADFEQARTIEAELDRRGLLPA